MDAATQKQPGVAGPKWFVKLVRTTLNGSESPVDVQTATYTMAIIVWTVIGAPFHVTMTYFTLGARTAYPNLGVVVLTAIMLWLLVRRTVTIVQGQAFMAAIVTVSAVSYAAQDDFRTIHLSGMELFSVVTYLLNLSTPATMTMLGVQKAAVIAAAAYNVYYTSHSHVDSKDLATLVGLSVCALVVYYPACRSRSFVLDNYRKEYKSALGHRDVAALQHFLFHELRNPLVVIVAALDEFISMTHKDCSTPMHGDAVKLPNGESCVQLAEYGRHGAEQVERLLLSMQEVLRLRAGDVEMTHTVGSIRDTIQEALGLVQSNADGPPVELVWEIPDVSVQTDLAALTQILRDLLRNATSYRSEVARLTVREYVPPEQCCVIRRAKTRWVEVAIENDGPGIPEAVLPQLFDMFALRSHRRLGGSGLGLVKCRLLCDAIKAEFRLDSRPGRTIATVRLPTVDADVRVPLADCQNIVDDVEELAVVDAEAPIDLPLDSPAVPFAGAGHAIAQGATSQEEHDFMAIRGVRGPEEALKNMRLVASAAEQNGNPAPLTNIPHINESSPRNAFNPLAMRSTNSSPLDAKPPQIDPSIIRVLFVDDVPANRLVGVQLLQRSTVGTQGRLRIDEAVDGEQAVEMYLRAIEVGNPYSLVYMDITMPVMDGWEASRAIRQLEVKHNSPRAVMVAVTGNTMPDDVERCLKCGMDDVYFKPYKTSQLYVPLESFLSR